MRPLHNCEMRKHRPISWIETCLIAERPQWILWFPVGMGIGIGVYFRLLEEPDIGKSIAVVFAASILVIFARSAIRRMAIAGLSISIGFACAALHTDLRQTALLQKPVGPIWITADVLAIERSHRRTRLKIGRLRQQDVQPLLSRATAQLSIRHGEFNAPEIDVGDGVAGRFVLRPPPDPAIPGAFDFQRHAYFNNIGAYGFAVSAIAVDRRQVIQRTFVRASRRLQALRDAIAVTILARDRTATGGVAIALLTGQRGYIPDQSMQVIRDAGIAHLLAISGLHIGLIATIVFAMTRLAIACWPALALRVNAKKIAACAALPVALGYAILTGFTVPTERAFLMTSLVLVGIVIDRRTITMRSVAWAAVVVLAFRPESLMEPGFQMSFAAVAALVAGYAWYRGRDRVGARKPSMFHGIQKYVVGVAATTVIASAATAPFAIYHFQHAAVFGLLTNLFAVPLAAFWIMPFGLLTLVTMPFGAEPWPIEAMLSGISVLLIGANKIADFPGAAATVPAPDGQFLVFVTLGGLWIALWNHPWRLLGVPAICIGITGPLFSIAPDIVVDGSARVVAVQDHTGSYFVSSTRRGKFEVSIWRRRAGAEGPPRLLRQDGYPTGSNIRCDIGGCIVKNGLNTVSIVLGEANIAEDCRRNDLVVALVPIRIHCQAMEKDRFDLWRDGTHAIYMDGTQIRIRNVRADRGRRPWVVDPRRGNGQ